MKRFASCLLSFILIASASRISAAETLTLTTAEGLSSNYVHTIFRDGGNLMWFGTENGLDRYDGQVLTHFTKRFSMPLKGAVRSIAEIAPGELLVGTTWGAFLYQLRQNLVWPIDFGRATLDVRCVKKLPDGSIFLATEKGLFTLNREKLKTDIVLCCNGSQPALNDILWVSPSIIRLGGDDGVYEFCNTKQGHLLRKIFNSAPVKCLYQLHTTLYIGTNDGLLVSRGTTFRPKAVKGAVGLPVLSLASDSAGALYIGTDNSGLLFIDKNTTAAKPVLADLPALKTVESLFCDETNTLWCGTFNGGVVACFLKNTPKFRTYEYPNSSNANFRSLLFAPDGTLQIGTRDGQLLTLDRHKKILRSQGNTSGKMFGSRILTTLHRSATKPDHLLIGTFGGGLSTLEKNAGTVRSFNDRIPDGTTVYQCYTEPSGRTWIATLNGLYRFDTSGEMLRINTGSCTGSNELFSLSPDHKGNLWIGTKTGVCLLSLKTNKLSQPETCKPYGYQCTAILTDSRGNTWFCFNKGGVLKLNQRLEKQLWLTSEIGIPENAPSSLVEDRQSNLWIGSSKGLYKVNTRNDIHAYGKEDGLNGSGFCPMSAVCNQDGTLWWLNEKGLVTYLNEDKNRNPFRPVIHLAELLINGTRYDADTMPAVEKVDSNGYKVNITGRENHKASLRFAALNYRFPGKNQYSFMLEKVDKSWSRASTNPVYDCPDLSPGTYTLLVKACNNDEVWTSTPTRVTLVLTPYFWESWWFAGLTGLLILFFLYWIIKRYLLKSKTRWLKELQEKKHNRSVHPLRPDVAERGFLIRQKLNECMQTERLYLNSELKLNELASAVGVPAHELSQILNTYMNQSFTDYINGWRIEEFKKQIVLESNQRYTHTAIAMQCGFNAKSSFLRAFRKVTGTTPSEYLKTSEKNHD